MYTGSINHYSIALFLGIFQKSLIGQYIRYQKFEIPNHKVLPNSNILAPHVFLGDEAFPLLTNLLKPYRRSDAALNKSKAIFNYRLSRARRLVENSFGILSNRFRIFNTEINLKPATIENMIVSACIIHNFLIETGVTLLTDDETNQDNSFVRDIDPTDNGENFENDAIQVRHTFKNYVNGAGAVDWQNNML